MDTINAEAVNRFRTAKTYKEALAAIKYTKKVFVPKRKCPGYSEFGIAAYDDNIALLTLDRTPIKGFDMDYIIFDAYDSQQFFNTKLQTLAAKYKLTGIALKVTDNKYFRFDIDNNNSLSIPILNAQ